MENQLSISKNKNLQIDKKTLFTILGGVFGLLGFGHIFLKKILLGITISALSFSFYIFTALLGYAVIVPSPITRFYASFISTRDEAINIFVLLSVIYGILWILSVVYFRRRRKKVDESQIVSRKIFSGSVAPILFLVILPGVASAFMLFTQEIAVLTNYTVVYAISGFVVLGIFFTVLGLYTPYSVAYPTDSYFKRRGYRDAITEYEYVKKILFVILPLLVLVAISSYFINSITTSRLLNMLDNQLDSKSISELLTPILQDEQFDEKLVFLQIGLVLVLLAGILKIALLIIKKDFRLCYAKACFQIVLVENNDTQQMKYFVLGLKSYNAYLKRHLKLEIKNMKKIISKISSSTFEEKSKLAHSIVESLRFGDLEALNKLAQHFEVSEPQELLSKQSRLDRLKERSQELAAGVTGLITIVVTINTILTDEGIKNFAQSYLNTTKESNPALNSASNIVNNSAQLAQNTTDLFNNTAQLALSATDYSIHAITALMGTIV